MKGGFFIHQIIYVDVLLVLNLLLNYFLLLSSGAIAHSKNKIIRTLLSSLLGSIYSLIIFVPDINIILSITLKIAVSILMILIAFGFINIKHFLRNYASFFLTNFMFAGLMLAVWLTFKPDGMIYQNGAVYFDINARVLTVSAIICYLISVLISHFLKRRAPDSHIVNLNITYKDNTVLLKALLDTGNTLTEPFSSYPVAVCEYKSLVKIIPAEIKELIESPAQIEPEINKDIRFISFKSVGGSGLLPAFKPDYITIKKGKNSFTVKNVYLAVYKNSLSNGEYNALIGNKIFESAQKGETTYKKHI